MSTEIGAVRERVRTDPRISRRRRTIARLRKRRSITIAAISGGVVVAVWVALLSPLLHVDRIQISGARHTDRTSIEDASGIGATTNLLLLSTTDVQRRVEALPWIKSAKVDRKLPGTVRIRVDERTPAMVLTLATSSWTLDARGRVLGPAAGKTRLTSIGGPALEEPRVGDRITDPAIAGGLNVWRSLPKSIRTRVDAILAPTTERISLAMGQTIIRYGAAEHFRSKTSVLKALLARLHARGISASYIDVSVPTNPAVGPPAASTTTTTPIGVSPTPVITP
jgi:cell division protein FtsQ